MISKGEGTSHFLLVPQPRAAVVLHFLCWENYWKRGSGRPSPAGWHRSSSFPCQALLGWEPAGPQRQQQAGGMGPAFQNPDTERNKSPRKRSRVAVAGEGLQPSSSIWESTASMLLALERAMVAVSKAHPGPGYLQVSAVGVKAPLPLSPPANTPIYANKHASALAQRSFSCHLSYTSCSVIQGDVGARVAQRGSPAPAGSG